MKGFNGDIYLKQEIIKLKNEFNIQSCIETGTHQANTTLELAKIFNKVKTIEIKEEYFNNSHKIIKQFLNNNKDIQISIYRGTSPNVLKRIILPYVVQPVLFYLDAHWYNYNPLLDELQTIGDFSFTKSVIVIHDFKVPNKDFGYDKFPNGKEYTFENIKEKVDWIYGENRYNYYYNERTSGANRGVIFITPKD